MLLIWVMPYAASAQSVKYSYDNAGNRIKREIVMKAKSSYKETSRTECFSEMLSDKDIRIYPNPTKGRLKIEIAGYENSDRCVLRILIHPDNKYSQHMLLLLGRNWTLVPGQTEFTSYIFP